MVLNVCILTRIMVSWSDFTVGVFFSIVDMLFFYLFFSSFHQLVSSSLFTLTLLSISTSTTASPRLSTTDHIPSHFTSPFLPNPTPLPISATLGLAYPVSTSHSTSSTQTNSQPPIISCLLSIQGANWNSYSINWHFGGVVNARAC